MKHPRNEHGPPVYYFRNNLLSRLLPLPLPNTETPGLLCSSSPFPTPSPTPTPPPPQFSCSEGAGAISRFKWQRRALPSSPLESPSLRRRSEGSAEDHTTRCIDGRCTVSHLTFGFAGNVPQIFCLCFVSVFAVVCFLMKYHPKRKSWKNVLNRNKHMNQFAVFNPILDKSWNKSYLPPFSFFFF